MPTGYTYKILEDDTFTVKDYMRKCMEAFLIDCRDVEFKRKIEVDDYYYEAVEKARFDVEKYRLMSIEDADKQLQSDYKESLKRHNEYNDKTERNLERLIKFRDIIKSWNAPTAEHERYHNFLLEQLDETIKYDGKCFISEPEPPAAAASQWLYDQLQSAIERHNSRQKSLDEAIERVNQRNEWVETLLKSIEELEE